VFVDQTTFEFEDDGVDVTILGYTLFSMVDKEREDGSFGVYDFYYIDSWTTEQHTQNHISNLEWLNEQV